MDEGPDHTCGRVELQGVAARSLRAFLGLSETEEMRVLQYEYKVKVWIVFSLALDSLRPPSYVQKGGGSAKQRFMS